MANEPMTWDSSGKLVPLTADEIQRQQADAHELWVESGNANAKMTEVIPISWDTGAWMILKDLGELGMEAVTSVWSDTKPRVYVPSVGMTGLSFLILALGFLLGLIFFPLSFLALNIGRRGYDWSLRRAVRREEAKKIFLG
ncbi:hypothetical protein [Fimbriimonas ginsengisoli]|uniref:Uncharacterized protein n=1 Tax=Fimbriimonas ginsengisoli Gsoil 348 TaxID=661478 RepID=A0A068NT31_FIMGI|nr:hypothetical protein [Fimbriimonas ginsengisoli]AIE86698.1 hypothetical protein OP10G_3330 [Fimbriimonas ginsengisoli Gsoil 348]